MTSDEIREQIVELEAEIMMWDTGCERWTYLRRELSALRDTLGGLVDYFIIRRLHDNTIAAGGLWSDIDWCLYRNCEGGIMDRYYVQDCASEAEFEAVYYGE